MNAKFIKKLIEHGEGVTVEFKRDLTLSSKEHQAEFCKDLMSLANIMRSVGKTSYLLIGVDDDGKIVGLREPLNKRQLKDAADRYCQPPVVFRYWQGIVDGKLIGVIIIPSSYRKPHKFKREFSGQHKRFAENTAFTRHLSHVVVASPEEIVALDQEAALLRKRRRLIISGISLLLLMLCTALLIIQGALYSRPVQEIATLIFPQGVPLLPSGFDPEAMPLHEQQVEQAFINLTHSPFEAQYALRVKRIDLNETRVASITIRYVDRNNYQVNITANYGILTMKGGNVVLCMKNGIYYEPLLDPKPANQFKNPFAQGVLSWKRPTELYLGALALTNAKAPQYKPWAKLARIQNRLVRVYERTAPILVVTNQGNWKGEVQEKAFITVKDDRLMRFTARGKAGPHNEITYEIGFEVTSLQPRPVECSIPTR